MVSVLSILWCTVCPLVHVFSLLYMTVMPETKGLSLLQIRQIFINPSKGDQDQATTRGVDILKRIRCCTTSDQKK